MITDDARMLAFLPFSGPAAVREPDFVHLPFILKSAFVVLT